MTQIAQSSSLVLLAFVTGSVGIRLGLEVVDLCDVEEDSSDIVAIYISCNSGQLMRFGDMVYP